jgi:hypothetical protein
MFIIFSECSAESMQGYDTSLIYLNWMQVYVQQYGQVVIFIEWHLNTVGALPV